MSTHNIGFYEDMTKIIFQLSSNIIKYAPYFLCCLIDSFFAYFWLPVHEYIQFYLKNAHHLCPLF